MNGGGRFLLKRPDGRGMHILFYHPYVSVLVFPIVSAQMGKMKPSDRGSVACNGALDFPDNEHHRLQLSRNLRDSPGFFEIVPGPGRRY